MFAYFQKRSECKQTCLSASLILWDHLCSVKHVNAYAIANLCAYIWTSPPVLIVITIEVVNIISYRYVQFNAFFYLIFKIDYIVNRYRYIILEETIFEKSSWHTLLNVRNLIWIQSLVKHLRTTLGSKMHSRSNL